MVPHDSELFAVLMPDRSVQLEWNTPAGFRLSPASQKLQDDIFARYTEDPDGWLFFLGFCARNVPLCASLAFWRDFSGLFVDKLKLTPELEQLRAEVAVPFEDEETLRLLEASPPMPGGEYLGTETLAGLWKGLQ